MGKVKKLLGVVTVVFAAGVFGSGGFINSNNPGWENSSDLGIWSKRVGSTGEMPAESEDLFMMQGTDSDCSVDYDAIIPVNPASIEKHSSGLSTDYLERNMNRLDIAMRQSSEIMSNLKGRSAEYMDESQIFIMDNSQMRIDEFEVQELKPAVSGVSSIYDGNIYAEVDISMPASVQSGYRSGAASLSQAREISSATMKVVGVLLRFGQEDRALSMIESELLQP